MEQDPDLEIFFVYKEIGTWDWKTLLSGSYVDRLPTCEFVTRVVAKNEKAAMAHAQKTYKERDPQYQMFMSIVNGLISSGKDINTVEQTAWALLNRVAKFYNEEGSK